MKSTKEICNRIALTYVESFQLRSKVTEEQKENFSKVLEDINKKRITNTDDFYAQLDILGIDKRSLLDLVANIITTGKSDDIVRMVFLLGEGKPFGEKSTGKGLKLLTESWVKRQLDDKELMRRIKPKFWPLFRDKSWLEKEQVK